MAPNFYYGAQLLQQLKLHYVKQNDKNTPYFTLLNKIKTTLLATS